MQELFTALYAETITTDWGSMPRYWFVDYDRDASEVYAEDYENGWNLYGFPYSMDGDHVVIDFKCGLPSAPAGSVLPLDFIVSNLARSSSREKSSMLKSSI